MSAGTLATINCPHCKKPITLNEVLIGPIEEETRRKYESEFLEKRKAIEEGAMKKIKKDMELELTDLRAQVKEKDKAVEDAKKQELALRKEKRKLEEGQKDLELEVQRRVDEQAKTIQDDAIRKAAESSQLKLKEREKTIEDLRKEIGELKIKAEQGSQKNQGEVLEIHLEKVLMENFGEDEIDAVVSGIRGADIVQKVCSNGKPCGTILYEAKNARWSNRWISKLKEDQMRAKADIGVIVTAMLPDGVKNFDYMPRERILIVDYHSIIAATALLRSQLIEVSRERRLNVDSTEKKDMLYNYLTSTEFRQKMQSVADVFTEMRYDLDKEKKAIMNQWEKREKHYDKAIKSVIGMYGGMKGIAGSAMPEIKTLDISGLLEEKD